MKWSLTQRGKEESDTLWMRCNSCGSIVYKKVVEERQQVCPECNFHFRITVAQRIAYTLDEGSFEELFDNLESADPLNFKAKKSYKEKYQKATKATGQRDAAIVGNGKIHGIKCTFVVIDANFIMGSMGSVVGEKIALAAEHALENKQSLIIVSGSGGGARMEEGLLSLFQMAKTSAAIKRLQDAGLCYITVLTNATMGGSMASWASLGDIIIAEPQALLGFAGPRVIANTVRQELPKGFQTSEFLMQHGFLDRVVERAEIRDHLHRMLRYVVPEQPAIAADRAENGGKKRATVTIMKKKDEVNA